MYTILLALPALLLPLLAKAAPTDVLSQRASRVEVLRPTVSHSDPPSVVARAPIKEFTAYAPVNEIGDPNQIKKSIKKGACAVM